MGKSEKNKDDIAVYIKDREYIANKYVVKCFTVTMGIFTITFILNLIGIFVVDKAIMGNGYFLSLTMYLLVYGVSKKISLSDKKTKFVLLFGVMVVYTIMGVTLTYHTTLVALLPFLYATLYSSKFVMRYVYTVTVLSTVGVVYGGYYLGLCDANMVLLTRGRMQDYVVDGVFTLTQVNPNPLVTLMVFYVVPRCLIYIAFVAVCRTIYTIVSGSLERAKLSDELEQAKEAAENANRAKSQFLARMSHEIRTPINAVLGMNEMILRESKEPGTVRYAKDIKDSANSLLSIINEILDSSKIESGKMEIINANYDISSVFNDIYNMISVRAKEKELDLIFDISPSIPNEYFGDDKRIKQVLLNLLTNAVKYTHCGSVTLKVTGTVEGEYANLRFVVIDTGIGIKPEDLEHIYDVFQRVDAKRNRYIEGAGLGLNIVQHLLQLMDSELHIESEYEKGSEFSFLLKQKVTNPEPIGDFKDRIAKANARQEVYNNYTAPNARILVVDDNKMNLAVVKGLLKQTQIQVFEADSGRKCLDMLAENRYDLIFLDHMMPEMDGIETFHIIKGKKLCEGVPIIMLTANVILGEKEKYLKEGFDGFLAKPIMPDKLDRTILRFLPKNLIVYKGGNNKGEKGEEQMEKTLFEKLQENLPEIDFSAGMSLCMDDEDFYLEIFNDFCELPILEELNKYMAENDHDNYCIRIHGFKNNAYTMGAKALGDLAYEMEKISKIELNDVLREKQEQLTNQYQRICEQYRLLK